MARSKVPHLIDTDERVNHEGRDAKLYRISDIDAMEDALREAAFLPECRGAYGKMAEALDWWADVFTNGGEPWDEDDQGRPRFDFTAFEVAVLKAALDEVRVARLFKAKGGKGKEKSHAH